jgi:hypothetical protein
MRKSCWHFNPLQDRADRVIRDATDAILHRQDEAPPIKSARSRQRHDGYQ